MCTSFLSCSKSLSIIISYRYSRIRNHTVCGSQASEIHKKPVICIQSTHWFVSFHFSCMTSFKPRNLDHVHNFIRGFEKYSVEPPVSIQVPKSLLGSDIGTADNKERMQYLVDGVFQRILRAKEAGKLWRIRYLYFNWVLGLNILEDLIALYGNLYMYPATMMNISTCPVMRNEISICALAVASEPPLPRTHQVFPSRACSNHLVQSLLQRFRNTTTTCHYPQRLLRFVPNSDTDGIPRTDCWPM